MELEEAVKKVWEDRVGAFTKAVKKTDDEIAKALEPLIGEPGQEALDILADPTAITDTDLIDAFKALSIPVGVLRKNIATLRGPKPVVEASAAAAGTAPGMDVLPAVPDDTSFLEMLKVGGILKPDKVDVIAAMRAGLANRVDLYDLPDTLVKKMESYAESVDEPCSEAFFEMLKVATARGYGDVLSALGVSGTFASEARKNKLLAKIDDTLWESFSDFHAQLKAWQEAWMSGAANPAMMSMAMAAMMGGGQLPPGMMAPPDASPVRDKAEAVINAINKVFSGPGIPVARALAYDALRIKSLLEDPRLPAQIGAANRDQMLKALGVSVTADYVRLERNVVKYALAIMELPNIASGNSEVIYLGALLQLGLSIPWAILLRSEGSGGKGKKQF